MRLNCFKHILIFGLLAICLIAPDAQAQNEKKDFTDKDRNAIAIKEFDAGSVALEQRDYEQAAAAFRRAIQADPDFAKAHQQFVLASRLAVRSFITNAPALAGETETARNDRLKEVATAKQKELRDLYEGWAKEFPQKAVYQWMLGSFANDHAKVEQYMLKAVRLDPKFAPAYFTLSTIVQSRGEKDKTLEYMKRAAESAPEEASYAFYYADALKEKDPSLHRKLSLEVAERFPKDNRGAQSLYLLADGIEDKAEKIALLERLKTAYPPDKFSWSESGMRYLFEIYRQTNPEKAVALAQEMSRQAASENSKKSWLERAQFQQNLMQARVLVNEKKFVEATALLEKTKMMLGADVTDVHLLKAEAASGAGNEQNAFDALLKLVTNEPNDAFNDALLKYGKQLGKSPAEVGAEVRRALDAKAQPTKNFSLARYTEKGLAEKNVTLADYRGKVVLLNFWYPFCGPCRGEAPLLQKALEKYGADKFVILAVNIHPEEDKFVMPYLKGMDYDFVPLRSTTEWAKQEYGVVGAPANFLIDREGRIVYQPGVIRAGSAARTLELQIESLLAPQMVTKGK